MQVVIIGNGIAGVTAAREIRKRSDCKISIVSAETDYFFSRTALMYVYMGHMKFEHTQPYENNFWKKNNIVLRHDYVKHVDVEKKIISLANTEKIHFDKLIIACGSKSNKFGWPGQDLEGVLGMYHKQDLLELQRLTPGTTGAVVVGGGLIGIELVEMLASRNIPVTFLVREDSFWDRVLPQGESKMINRHILEHGINLKLGTGLKEIIADENGRAKAVVTDKDETIPCQIVGLTAGVSPNIDFLKESGIALGQGIKVSRFLETNIKDIFAIGDCAEQHEPIGNRRTIEAVWYTGRMMGEAVAQTICGTPVQYNPGNWFNSAKFLDIEYQTYGWVWSSPRQNEDHFYWEHSSGKKCITVAYDIMDRRFLGINVLGIRMKHDFFDKVLIEKRTVDYVIENLAKANFDPEFFSRHEREILNAFRQKNQAA